MSIVPADRPYDRRLLNNFLTILYGRNGLSSLARFKEQLGLDRVDNVRDIDKPVSLAVAQSILNGRVVDSGNSGGTQGTSLTWSPPSAMRTWMIPHGLGRRPHVSVFNSQNELVFADVKHLDNNVLSIDFTVPLLGSAELM